MKRTHGTSVIVLALVFLAGCHGTTKAEEMDLQRALIGTWATPGGLANPRVTEWGPMIFEMTFMPDGILTVTLTSISPNGEAEDHVESGPYQVIGKELVTELMYKGEPVRLKIEGDRLFLHGPEDEMELVRTGASD